MKNYKTTAINLIGWFSEACGEMVGYDDKELLRFADKEDKKRLMAAKRNGVQDLCGWWADEMYNDPIIAGDVLGDKIFDETSGDPKKMVALCKAVKEVGHTAVKKAMDKMIAEYSKK